MAREVQTSIEFAASCRLAKSTRLIIQKFISRLQNTTVTLPPFPRQTTPEPLNDTPNPIARLWNNCHAKPPATMASKAEIAALKDEVYEACVPIAKDNPRIVLRQADILDLDIIPNGNLQTLLDVAQSLLNEKLFKVVHDTDGMGWKLRTVDEAKKYVSPQLQTLRGRMRANISSAWQIPRPVRRARSSLLPDR